MVTGWGLSAEWPKSPLKFRLHRDRAWSAKQPQFSLMYFCDVFCHVSCHIISRSGEPVQTCLKIGGSRTNIIRNSGVGDRSLRETGNQNDVVKQRPTRRMKSPNKREGRSKTISSAKGDTATWILLQAQQKTFNTRKQLEASTNAEWQVLAPITLW
jgi:hypothetical protein